MPTSTSVKNFSQLNTVRIRFEVPEMKDEIDKHGKPTGRQVATGKWVASPRTPEMALPGKSIDVFLAYGQMRAVLEELPT